MLTVEIHSEQGQALQGKPGVHKCSAGSVQPTEACMIFFFTGVRMSSPALNSCHSLLPLSVELQPGYLHVLKSVPLPTHQLHYLFLCPQSVYPSPPLILGTCRVSQDSEIMRGGAWKSHCIPVS